MAVESSPMLHIPSIPLDPRSLQLLTSHYPLVNVNGTTENHHFEQVNQRTQWAIFNSKLLNYQRVDSHYFPTKSTMMSVNIHRPQLLD